MKISIEITTHVDKSWTKEALFFSLASESWYSKVSIKSLLILISLDYQTPLSPKLQGLFFPSNWASKSFNFEKKFRLVNCRVIFLASQLWQQSEKSKTCFFVFNSLSIQTSFIEAPQFRVPPSRTQPKTYQLQRNFELENPWFCALH